MKILVLSPHCDDAEIAMGGTMARFVSQGHEIKLINTLISGTDFIYPDSKPFEFSKKYYDERLANAHESAKILGIDMQFLDLDPFEFRYDRKHIELFDKLVLENNPDKIFTVWNHDSHYDHHVLSRIVSSISRKNKASVYMFENMIPGGITPQSFNPQMYVNISDFAEVKKKSLRAYTSALNSKTVDSIFKRSGFRGGQIGVNHAETFEIVKELVF